MLQTLTAGCAAFVLAAAPAVAAGDADAALTPADLNLPDGFMAQADERWGMLGQYCEDCHNFEDWAGGVAFDTMTADAVPQDAEIWEEAVRKLRGGLMPPPGEERPDHAQQDAFISWMETYLDQVGAARENPGHVALHRLNRAEYANAVRDLLAIDVDAAALLPKDDIADGFDNIADVLQVSPTFLEQFIAAADIVSGQAVGDPAPPPSGATYIVRGSGRQHFHVEGLPLGTRGGAVFEHLFPADGDYRLSLNDMATGGYVIGMEFEQTIIVTVDGVKVYETRIGGEEDMRAIDQHQAPAVSSINARLKDIPITVTAGPHKIGAAFLQRSFAESDADLHPFDAGGGQDRLLAITSLDIRGPFDPTGLATTPSRAKIFSCHPQAESEQDACAHEIFERLAREAFRRPVGADDLGNVFAVYDTEKARGGWEAGVRGGLTAILASPYFLYRSEPAPAGLAPGDVFALSDLELASRLSFFLWSSAPDDELLDVAARGRLHERDVLEAQVRRMLADPKSESLSTNFAFQWLRVNKAEGVDPDPTLFPYFDDALRAAFREEMRLFVDSVFREDQSVVRLLDADYTFVNERLALHYGINGVRGSRFRRVRLDDSNRWGVLGKGAILLGTSYPNRTAPVLRGAYILESITGTPPATPPPGVPAFKETQDGETAETVRDRMIAHRTDPLCNSCHGVMDPLGLALENFDAVGQWRDVDRFAGEQIDPTTELPDGTPVAGPDDLRKALLQRPDQFVQTMVENMMTFALGRSVEYYDMPEVRKIVHDAAADDYRFTSLVLGVVESAPFQMRQVPMNDGEVEEASLQQ